jgi:lipopolysaccharide assembly protein A
MIVRFFMMLVYLVLIVLGVTFAALNATSVQVNFYVHTFTIPISVLLILVLGVGILIGFFLFIVRYWRLKAEFRKIKNQLKITEREIKNLRAIPLQDQH